MSKKLKSRVKIFLNTLGLYDLNVKYKNQKTIEFLNLKEGHVTAKIDMDFGDICRTISEHSHLEPFMLNNDDKSQVCSYVFPKGEMIVSCVTLLVSQKPAGLQYYFPG